MPRQINITSLCIFFLLSLLYSGESVYAQTDFSPQNSVVDAIERAKLYAGRNDINLDGKFIKKVEYHSNMQNRREQSYWLVLWINKHVTKGGGVELRLYTDGSIKENYYK